MTTDLFFSVRVPNNEVVNFPNNLTAERDLILASELDIDDLPRTFIRSFSHCKASRNFIAGPKNTQIAIFKITNCEFPGIKAPNDGTILEIDESSKNHALQRLGITGFVIQDLCESGKKKILQSQ